MQHLEDHDRDLELVQRQLPRPGDDAVVLAGNKATSARRRLDLGGLRRMEHSLFLAVVLWPADQSDQGFPKFETVDPSLTDGRIVNRSPSLGSTN